VQAARQRAGERQANELSVRLELQADCLAGVWAKNADAARGILEAGDVEEALRAASAIGDDTLQKQAQGYAVPDSFTHGSAEQRMRWFKRGMDRASWRPATPSRARRAVIARAGGEGGRPAEFPRTGELLSA
jgi:predicted metalloprotease